MKGEQKMKNEQQKPSLAKRVLGGATAVAVASSFAHAELDVSGIKLDVSQVEVIGLTIMTALGVIWVVKKVISML